MDTLSSGKVSAFARKCDLGESLVRKYISGSEPGVDKIIQIAAKCEVCLLWLLKNEGAIFLKDQPLFVAEERAPYNVDGDDFVYVPYYDVKASAGLGIENGEEVTSRPLAFRRDWWNRKIPYPPSECYSLEITGNSMFPVLTENHTPIFYTGEKEVLVDAIYNFRHNGDVFVKYLDRVPGGINVRSENPNMKGWHIGDEDQHELTVIGRLVFKQLTESA